MPRYMKLPEDQCADLISYYERLVKIRGDIPFLIGGKNAEALLAIQHFTNMLQIYQIHTLLQTYWNPRMWEIAIEQFLQAMRDEVLALVRRRAYGEARALLGLVDQAEKLRWLPEEEEKVMIHDTSE